MFKVLQTSSTPNPNALKFHLDQSVLKEGSKSFLVTNYPPENEALKDLFQLDQITSVFCIGNVITVNKKPQGNWDDLIPKIADILEEKLKSLDYLLKKLEDQKEPLKQPENGNSYSSSLEQDFFSQTKESQIRAVNQILDTSVRPGLAGDGGGLALIDIQGEIVQVHYEGACGSCPSSTGGTLQFIESTLQKTLHPKIKVQIH